MMRPRNRLYHRYILDTMKVEATGEGAVVSAAERAAIMGSRTVWDYDDVFIAPALRLCQAPWTTTSAAGRRASWAASASRPWCWRRSTIPGYPERSISAYDWAGNPSLSPVLTDHGGHVGFHGIGNRQPWSDLVVARFFDHG